MFYSPSKNGFYDTIIHGDNIPADAVEITVEQHAALLEGQSQGKVIAADANGLPTLQDPPPPTPPGPPQVVSRFQARAALHLAGLLDDVNAMMADPATPMLARLAWQDAQEFRRQSPTVLAMAAELNLTDAQIDQLFITAAAIEA
jgi:hypothetical protein